LRGRRGCAPGKQDRRHEDEKRPHLTDYNGLGMGQSSIFNVQSDMLDAEVIERCEFEH